jgi:general secretion pathway protein D
MVQLQWRDAAKRLAALRLARVLLTAVAVQAAFVPVIPMTANAAQYDIAFVDADIREATDEVLGRQLHLAYTVDPSVTGKITFRVAGRMSSDQLLTSFEAALAANDVVLLHGGNGFIVTTRSKAKGSPSLKVNSSISHAAGYQLVAIPISFVTASDLAKTLQSTTASNLVVYADDRLGVVVLGGTARELDAGLEIIRQFDRSGLEATRFSYVEIINTSATTIAAEFQQVAGASGLAGVTVLPLKRLNGVLIFAHTPAALKSAESWVARLDVRSREDAPALWIYRPKNISADALSQALTSILGGGDQAVLGVQPAAAATGAPPAATSPPAAGAAVGAPGGGSLSLGGDPVRIAVERSSNTLIISASASRWATIRALLTELDRTPDQVLIDVQIIEVTLSDEFRFGVDWKLVDGTGRTVVQSTGAQSAAISPQFPGLSVTYLGGDLSATLNALGGKTRVEVLSSPKLVALDNRTAKLQVGDQVPVVTQTSRSTTAGDSPTVASIEYRNTGVILEVTPRINSDNTVVLQISQEASSVAKTTTSGIESPTIQQRRIETTLMVGDGKTIALGGLISTSRSKGDSGVPFLKDIPVLGSLFKRQSNEGRRTELIVLITPHVQRGDADPSPLVEDMVQDMHDIVLPEALRAP